MNVRFEKTEDEGVFSFTLSYGDTLATGRVIYGAEDESGTRPCTIEHTSGKPNLVDNSSGRSVPIDADVHIMAAFGEFISE